MASSNRPCLILLVRHGQTPTTGVELYGRKPGVHLSETGTEQARTVGMRLAAMGTKQIAAIYSSPLERTKETARAISKEVGIKVKQERGLLELDVGDWTGRKLSHLRKLNAWSAVQKYPSGFRFPNGESFVEMQTRMSETVTRLVKSHPGETIVAVSHADPIRALVAHSMGTHLDLFQRTVVSPCSVTAILYTSGGPIVLSVNNTGELSALSPA
ncbi:MAG: MSMEG_4193 family putative phosphomutase [Acidimicrobiales bacterium]|nr:MSMEG_4193 family putative phosphomutase [Actinomycetota bacterium]MEC9088059.1 MSMEG_4193 family putative phosphomutase [Actinomycetota bacterium]